MSDQHDFPTRLAGDDDDDAGAGTGALRWTAEVIALTALALALFNAGAIAAWAEDLVPGPTTTHAVVAAERWQGATARLGFGAAHTDLHQVWKRLETLRWSDLRRD